MPPKPARPAKITTPQPRGVYPRTRLFPDLEKAPCVWVQGPPGCGKTMLAVGYLQACDRLGLWYQCDKGDADVATVFYYLQLAARRASSRRHSRLPLYTQEYRGSLSTFALRFFERLYGWQTRPFVLVLDNYQLVPEEADLHRTLIGAIEALPARGHIVVLSRAAPPPAFARLRANGALAVLDWDGLRLSGEEARGIVALKHGAELPATMLESLIAQADGWAAGLILLLESEVEGRRPVTLSAEHLPQALFDYFAAEILDREGSETQAALVRIALLPKATEQMAVELTGNRRAGRTISRLHQQNFFTQRYARSPAQYQFHPLFRAFLLERLKSGVPADELGAVFVKAAALLEANGQQGEAVGLYVDARAWNEAVRLICEQAPGLLSQGRGAVLGDWVRGLPAAVAESAPWLSYWLGCEQLFLDPAAARALFEKTYESFTAAGDLDGQLLSWCGIVDAFLTEWHDYHPLDRWIAEGERFLEDRSVFPSGQIEAKFLSSLCFALCYRCPEHRLSATLIERVDGLIRASPDPNFRVLASGHLMGFYHYLGDGTRARALMEILKRDASDAGLSPALRFHALRAGFIFYWMTGEPRAGVQAADEAAELCREHGLHAFGATVATTHLLAHLALGNVPKIRECVESLRHLSPARFLNASYLHWVLGWAAWICGDLEEAKARMALSFANTKRAGSPFPSAYAHIALAVLHHESGELAEAREQTAQARRIGHEMQSATILHHCALLEASLALSAGDEPACLEALGAAFAIGKTHGLYHSYWWDRKRASRLCALALRRGVEPDYARAMVRRTRLAPDLSDGRLLEWPWPIKIYAFGDFRLVLEGKPGVALAGGPRKVMELLKLLVAARGQSAKAAYAAEQLWPDADGDTAHGALKTTVHRLRRRLDCPEAVLLGNGLVGLNPEVCWTDVGAFERLLNDADPLRPDILRQAIALYAGALLAGDGDPPWLIAPRERARHAFLQAVGGLARHWEERKRWADAIAVYERGLDVDDLIESFYSGLMRCHGRLGQRAQGLRSYERCREVLAARFAIEPSPEIRALARGLRNR